MLKATVKINGKYYHIDNLKIFLGDHLINGYRGKIEKPIRYAGCFEVELNKDQYTKLCKQLEDFCKEKD